MIVTKKILRQWLVACSKDDFRPGIHQLYFDKNKIVATDGHRLHVHDYDHDLPVGTRIPRRVLEAAMLLGGVIEINVPIGDTELSVGKHILITPADTGADFPPWRQVVPGTQAYSTELTARALLQAVEDTPTQTINSVVAITLEGVVEAHPGDAPHANANLIKDAVKASGAGMITLRWSDPLDPIVVEVEGFLAVVMPCRV